MRKTLEKVISNNNNGLFLLDPPTGFGKTTVVVDLIRRFIKGDHLFSNVKKIFFFTNLKTNLPYNEVFKELSVEEKSQCLIAKATHESVIENFLNIEIGNKEIVQSKEYKKLRSNIESYKKLDDLCREKDDADLRKTLKSILETITTISEPAFRKLIKQEFFYDKSIVDKKKTLQETPWIKLIYPICDIDKYKVVFLTTKKFVLPIDTFQRLPYYLYCDNIINNSIVFIDEFDSTKDVLLKQIVEDGLKDKTDIVKLFLDIHFALQNFVIPKKLLKESTYHQRKVDDGLWYTTAEHFSYWKAAFDKIYKEYKIDYLIKSVDFDYNKAFLFNDGRYFNIIKDSAKKFINVSLDEKEDILSLRGKEYQFDGLQINILIKDLERCIDGFTKSVFFISNNYVYSRNESKQENEIKYTFEEAIYSVLEALNLSEVEKEYLFNKIQTGDFILDKKFEYEGGRKGFNFTEIEDSEYHDVKSVIHNYNFATTPEDILIKLAQKALVVGISATAKIETCIGNYDQSYVSKELKENYIKIEVDDETRIENSFNTMISETKGQYEIHPTIIDDFNVFSDKEKCKLVIEKLFNNANQQKFLDILSGDIDFYYFLIELKIALVYLEMKQKGFKSCIAFLNSFPKTDGKLNLDRLREIFEAIDAQYVGQNIHVEIIKSEEFDYALKKIHDRLSNGEAVFLITTYQTIGSGKNIQYTIPSMLADTMIMAKNDDRNTKDFDAIYLLTPTNLIQQLNYDSENKYNDLGVFLFQQEYLYKNGYLTYGEMKNNIENGFRRTFFNQANTFYTKNGDINNNTLRLTIQAIGRLCRCRNKNKHIYIYADKEVVERIQTACIKYEHSIFNEEFRALLELNIGASKQAAVLEEYSRQSRKTYIVISQMAYKVRSSKGNIDKWVSLRDYVLKNPTTDTPLDCYKDFYFNFDNAYSGYCYKQAGRNYDIVDMKMDIRNDMSQVSSQAADLPIILSIPCVKQLFEEKGYALYFKRALNIMNPSLFKQVYLGALGEVVGKCILDRELGWNLEELDDVSFYEYFDFKLGNMYFDFKHWNEFRVDHDKYAKKVQKKLSKIKGAKCFVINLVKRTEARSMTTVNETVVEIPYLIDGENATINFDAIEYINNLYE